MPRYLSADEIRAFNGRFLGSPQVRDETRLLALAQRPAITAFYQHADIASLAAVLIEGIALGHPFVDANKRTAALAGLVFLDLNGYGVYYHQSSVDDEYGERILALVTHQETVEQLADWLRQHLRERM